MKSIRLTLPYCNPYLTETNLGMVVPMQETKFSFQLTAAVKFNRKKGVKLMLYSIQHDGVLIFLCVFFFNIFV